MCARIGQEDHMQPIIFDHVNKVVIQVGTDPESAKKYADLVAAQRPPVENEPESSD